MADRSSDLGAIDEIVAEARERWSRCDEAENKQRESILAAKKFRSGDQWPETVRIERQGGQAIQGQAAQPPKPLVTIDRVSQPVRQISNQIKQAEFGIDVLPNGHGADDDTAEIFKGMLRRVQVLARAEAPVEWAADQAIEGGLGWFRIETRYVRDDWPKDASGFDVSLFDQELRLERIPNNLSVYCDPTATKPTKRDAQYMFVTQDLAREEFERLYPHNRVVGVEDFAAVGNMKEWVTNDTIRIAEYWRYEYEDATVYLLENGQVVGSLKDMPPGLKVIGQRQMSVPAIYRSKINAVEVLKKADGTPHTQKWHGTLGIPLIPIIGEELNVDGQTIYRGMIQGAMDAQRMINYHYSGAILAAANATLAPWLVATGQLNSNARGQWQYANRYNYAFLEYDRYDERGRDLGQPIKNSAGDAAISSMVQLLAVSEDALKATMAFWDPSLGKASSSQESGKRVLALQKQTDLASSNFGDNVMRALYYAGELMCEILPVITRKGQILQVLGVDDEPQQILIGQHYTQGDNGAIQPVFAVNAQQVQQGETKFYDLNKGRYAVTVNIGQEASTMRQEGVAAVGDLIPKLPPEMAMAIAPEWVSELSFPGAQRLAEQMRKALPPALQDQDGSAANVQQLQAQNQQLQMALQQLQPLADKHQADILKTREAKSLEGQIAQMKEDAETSRLRLKLAAEIEIARIQASKQSADLEAEAAEERLALGVNTLHEATQAQLDREHEMQLAQQQHEQALQQGAQQADIQAQQQANQPQETT